MANIIRGENGSDREWWLEMVNGYITLCCSGGQNDSEAWYVLNVTRDGSIMLCGDIGPDSHSPKLQLTKNGYIKIKKD